MRHYWVTFTGCVDTCAHCGIRRDKAVCGECLDSDTVAYRKGFETVSAENFVCDCCGENPCQCGEDMTAAEVYSVHYTGI